MHIVQAKGILSAKNGMNIYRGCSHGCIYCDSRSECYHIEHDFEDIAVKGNALALLEQALQRKRTKCMIGTGSMSDPYLPLEHKLNMTRKAIEIIYRYGFGFTCITKSSLVLRDIELLKAINQKTKCVVQMTLTTYDEQVCSIVEPHVATSRQRLEVLKRLHEEGIPTVVWLSPILPFINDTVKNLEGILHYCAQAKVYGIICFGMGLTLRSGNREYFYSCLDTHFPGLKEEYIRLYGNNYSINSVHHAELMHLFHARCKEYGIEDNLDVIFSYLNTFETTAKPAQLELFFNK